MRNIRQNRNSLDDFDIDKTPYKTAIEFHKSYYKKTNKTLLKILLEPGYASEVAYSFTSMLPEKEENRKNYLLGLGLTLETVKAGVYGYLAFELIDKLF